MERDLTVNQRAARSNRAWTAKVMFYTISKFARKYIIKNIKHMCDECLDWQVHQTPCGKLLCDKCNKRYIKKKESWLS